MARIRFLTAIAVGATVARELEDQAAADGRTPAYLAYEWIVVEALARCRRSEDTYSVPGIEKARSVLKRSPPGHLDAGSYLQVPKVFGFHGVYKRLAWGMSLVDAELLLMGRGEALLRAWEREREWIGFADRIPGSPGCNLARRLRDEVRRTLAAGRVMTGSGSHLWRQLSDSLGPGDAGRREKALLWEALIDESMPVRRELVLALRGFTSDPTGSEAEVLRAMRAHASTPLRSRLMAIETSRY
jgi:hypothetical protein